MSKLADQINDGQNALAGIGRRTKVIAYKQSIGGWTWRVPVLIKGRAVLQIVPPEHESEFADEATALASGMRRVKKLLPAIRFE